MEPISLGLGIASLGASLFGMNEEAKHAKEQNKLLEQQQALAEKDYYANLQLQQDWKEKYGGIEHNMITYVQQLDANHIAGIADGRLKKSYEVARKNIDSHLATRGFDVAGGVHADMFTQLADMEAQASVQLKTKAEEYVQQQQQNLLSHNPMPNNPSTAGMQNSLSNQINAGNQQFKGKMDSANDVAKSLGNIYDSASGGTFDKAMKKYLTKNNLHTSPNQPDNVTTNTQTTV